MGRERERIDYIWCHAQLIDYGGQYYNIREAILKLLEFQAPLAQCCHVSADIAARQTEFLDLRRLLQRQQHRLLHVEQPCRGGASICWRELRWKCETISKKSMGWKHSSYSSIRGWIKMDQHGSKSATHFHFHTSVREVNCIALACFETCQDPVAHGAML
jgi:hypothetical protein